MWLSMYAPLSLLYICGRSEDLAWLALCPVMCIICTALHPPLPSLTYGVTACSSQHLSRRLLLSPYLDTHLLRPSDWTATLSLIASLVMTVKLSMSTTDCGTGVYFETHSDSLWPAGVLNPVPTVQSTSP